MTRPYVTDVRLYRAADADRASGLLGHVSCVVNDLRICVTLRRTRSGRHSISLPRRRGHLLVSPLTPEATRAMELQILAQLGLEDAP